VLVSEQTTYLYLTTALLHLPPRQRAAVIARDLLDFDAEQTAAILGCSVPAANSLVQRGRTALHRLVPHLDDLRPPPPAEYDALVRAYVDAHQRGDVDAIVNLLHADVHITMPPEPPCRGMQEARDFFAHVLADGPGTWRLLPTSANGWPAFANYLRPPGSATHDALSIDVLRIRDGRIAAIHCFLGDATFPAFGLDRVIPGTADY
jgi:RNA polymerase sigma-70 factor (ECF subfamily)